MPKPMGEMQEAKTFIREVLRILRNSKVDRSILRLAAYGLELALQKAFEAGVRSVKR